MRVDEIDYQLHMASYSNLGQFTIIMPIVYMELSISKKGKPDRQLKLISISSGPLSANLNYDLEFQRFDCSIWSDIDADEVPTTKVLNKIKTLAQLLFPTFRPSNRSRYDHSNHTWSVKQSGLPSSVAASEGFHYDLLF